MAVASGDDRLASDCHNRDGALSRNNPKTQKRPTNRTL
jgi:hypothetical protein